MLISVIFTLFFAILHSLNINNIGDLQATNNYIHAAFVLPAYFLFKQKKITLNFCAHYFLIFCFLTSITAILTAEYDSFRAIWFFLSTMITFIFVGKKYGQLYGYSACIFIIFSGFILESNLNTQSVLSSLIALFVLILVMSAYTGQMEKHLNHIDQIQQELYYLANKSSISNSLVSDQRALEVEQLLKNAQALNDSFALIYIDVESLTKMGIEPTPSFWNDVRAQLTRKLKLQVSASDIVSQINEHLFYIALPNKDALSIRDLVDKIDQQVNNQNILVNGKNITLDLCVSVTTLQASDSSTRALHIRADKGLTKAKAMGGKQIVFVDV
ncbi:MAG: GGDEF domain-containing protein [Thalassotalea sp.]